MSGFAPFAHHLTAHQVEHLRRSRRIDHLEIVLRPQQQKPSAARRRMLRPRAFVAVRQQHRQTRQMIPFVFRRGDELIDDDLCRVPEIAELRFPDHQSAQSIERVAVFKAQHADFRERRIVNSQARLVGRQMMKRHKFVAVFDVCKTA